MSRPKIRPPYSQPERLMQSLAFVLLLALIILTVISMIKLPERIPSHFGFDGRPDAWGGKASLLLMPVIAVIIYAGTTALERFPWIYNYAVEITEKNAACQYKLGRLTLEWIKLVTIAIFLYLQWLTCQVASGISGGLDSWFMPVSLVCLFGGLGFSIYKMVKNK